MKQILIYADSLTWGIIPDTRKRLIFNDRWPGVFENHLKNKGVPVRVIENCINGRRTVWDDPFKDGRNGSVGLAQVMEMNSPLSLVILMLGTNDFQSTHNNNAWLSAQGSARLIDIIRNSPIEPGMPIPKILLVAPPPIIKPNGVIAEKFKDAEKRCVGLSSELKKVADSLSTFFFDSARIITASSIDGIHLDRDQHQTLGTAIGEEVLSYNIL